MLVHQWPSLWHDSVGKCRVSVTSSDAHLLASLFSASHLEDVRAGGALSGAMSTCTLYNP